MPNHGDGCPAPVDDLAGREMHFNLTDGGALALRFGPDGLEWDEARERSLLAAEVFAPRPGCYFVDCTIPAKGRSRALVLDLARGMLMVIDILAPAPDAPDALIDRVRQRGSQSAVDMTYRFGGTGAGPTEAGFARTAALVGKGFRYRYSPTHCYDHLYLSERYYAWFCRQGPDAALGDFDECDYFAIADDLVLVCWREKLLPCVGVIVEDHLAMRSLGKIFGADSQTGESGNAVVGADISFLADLDPR